MSLEQGKCLPLQMTACLKLIFIYLSREEGVGNLQKAEQKC